GGGGGRVVSCATGGLPPAVRLFSREGFPLGRPLPSVASSPGSTRPMTRAPLDLVVRQARHLTQPHATHLRADGDLLLDFLAANDQPAFEAIVRRHGS